MPVEIPNLPRDESGGIPKWVLYAGGGVAIVALFVFMRKQQTSTVAGAGTSINAALGSLQEGQLLLSEQAGKNAQQQHQYQLASLFASNQVAWAGSESAMLNNPDLTPEQRASLTNDINARLASAFDVWRRLLGGSPKGTPELDTTGIADQSGSHQVVAASGTF